MIWSLLAACGTPPAPIREVPAPVQERVPAPPPPAAPPSHGLNDDVPATGDVGPTALAAGAACLDGSQCASGVCEGEGCDEASPGVCAPDDRACTTDRHLFCGCDDETLYASSTCPGQRYAHEGACPEVDEGDPMMEDGVEDEEP